MFTCIANIIIELVYIFQLVLLEYNFFTMLCSFLLYTKMNQLCVCVCVCVCVCTLSCSVVSNSLQPHGLMDCRLPGSSVHEIFQAKILEQVAISYSRGSSRPKDNPSLLHWKADSLLLSQLEKLICITVFFFQFRVL